jgi:integrase
VDWGQAQRNYDEFRFFRGLRPFEQIALLVHDCDLSQGKLKVSKACVMKRNKDRTKTGEDRHLELYPRARRAEASTRLESTIEARSQDSSRPLFFRDDGKPMRDLNHPYDRWRWTLRTKLKARYREPYNARHFFVSWNLIIGKNLLWVAEQHGHSVSTMVETYGAWIEGSQAEDLDAIKRAMESSPRSSFQLRIAR